MLRAEELRTMHLKGSAADEDVRRLGYGPKREAGRPREARSERGSVTGDS